MLLVVRLSRPPIALAVLCLLWVQGWSAPHRLGHVLELLAADDAAARGGGHVHAHGSAGSFPYAREGHAHAERDRAHAAPPTLARVVPAPHGGGDDRDGDGLDCPSCPGVGAWLAAGTASVAAVATASETRRTTTVSGPRAAARARCTIRGPPREPIRPVV